MKQIPLTYKLDNKQAADSLETFRAKVQLSLKDKKNKRTSKKAKKEIKQQMEE